MEKKYQGREFNIHLQAPTLAELNGMIRGIRDYARKHNIEKIKVLQKGADPDGGFEAVIKAHNWNPIGWIKEKWEARGGGYQARLEREEERLERERKKAQLDAERAETKMLRAKTKTKALLVDASEKRAKLKLKRAKEDLGERSLIDSFAGLITDPFERASTKKAITRSRKRATKKRTVRCPSCSTLMSIRG